MKHKTSSEEGIRQIVVDMLNSICVIGEDGWDFWCRNVVSEIGKRFGPIALTIQEMSDIGRIFQTNSKMRSLLVKAVCSMTGVVLTKLMIEQLDSDSSEIEFLVGDITEIVPVVKHMHQVDFSEGVYVGLVGVDKRDSGKHNAGKRFGNYCYIDCYSGC